MNTSIISLHTHVPTYIQAQIQMCIHNASNQHTTRTYVHPNTRHTSLQILHPFGHGGFTPAKLESRFLSENDAHSEPTSVWYVSDKHAKIYIWTWMHTCHTWWPLTPPLLPHSCELQALSVAQARYARNISVGELMNVTDDEYRAVWQAAGDNPANHTFPLSLSCLLSLSLALSRSLALSLSRYPSVEPVYKRIFGHTHHVSQNMDEFQQIKHTHICSSWVSFLPTPFSLNHHQYISLNSCIAGCFPQTDPTDHTTLFRKRVLHLKMHCICGFAVELGRDHSDAISSQCSFQKYVSIRGNASAYTQIFIIYICVFVCIYTYMCVGVLCVYIYIYVYMCLYIHIYVGVHKYMNIYLYKIYVCMYM